MGVRNKKRADYQFINPNTNQETMMILKRAAVENLLQLHPIRPADPANGTQTLR